MFLTISSSVLTGLAALESSTGSNKCESYECVQGVRQHDNCWVVRRSFHASGVTWVCKYNARMRMEPYANMRKRCS